MVKSLPQPLIIAPNLGKKITDIIIDATAPRGPNAQARLNTFLQTWNIPARGARADRMHSDTKRMLDVSRNHNANFAAIQLSQGIKMKLPAWLQIGAGRRPPHSKAARCLLTKHKM